MHSDSSRTANRADHPWHRQLLAVAADRPAGLVEVDAFECGCKAVGVALAADLAVGDNVDAGPLHRSNRQLGGIILCLLEPGGIDPPQLMCPNPRHASAQSRPVDQPFRLRVAADDSGGQEAISDPASIEGRHRERLGAAQALAALPARPAKTRFAPDALCWRGMELRTLGHTGVRVSSLCLGTMMFGASGNTDHEESVRIIHRALDAGINFVDTADRYSQGESEEIVAKALAGGKRDQVVLATKFHLPMGDGPNQQGSSRRWIMQEVEASLRRLGTDWIDLYQVHRPDPSCDIDETLGALTDLVRAGKVRYIGSSTFPAHEIVEAQWVAERRGRERFVCEQPPYSMLTRGIEADVLPVCEKYGLGVIPWSPLSGGWLAGRYRRSGEVPRSARIAILPKLFDPDLADNQRKLDAAEELALLAEEAGLTLIQMALAFVVEHPAITAAIIGPRTMEHLESHLAAADVRLDRALLDRIDEIVPPGTNVNPADAGWQAPALASSSLRRRSA